MKIEKDYEDLLRLFNKHKARYCVVGAYALAFHAMPRYTKDMDILVKTGIENGRKIIKALDEFGFKSLKLRAEDFDREGAVIQLGYEPIRVDLLTSIEGVDFEEVWKNRARGSYGKGKISFIGMNELIKSKKAVWRKQDEADLEILRAVKMRKKKK
ncbi:MAG: hypothetical protein Q7S07_01770 [Candidatus Omnitrophota bacterium]|nr:hypothetical protein [Candidatus Omnitrophota bacterium]